MLINIFSNLYPQTPTNYQSKRGGICFRTDDDQPISHYLEYASLFNKYNQKFTFAINFGMPEMTTAYAEKLKEIQAKGHEILDHTPIHRTSFFNTILTTDYYKNHPGVHNISGNKVELNFVKPDTSFARTSGYVNIRKDTVISPSGIFSSFSKSDCYLYFPSIDKLVFIHEIDGWIDQNTVKIRDFWINDINLGTHQNIQFFNFDFDNIHLAIDGIKALGEEQIRMANYYNLERPFSWVQPGGYHPHLYSNELKLALGDRLGYKSAGVFPMVGLKVFNEYNPQNDQQFGMNYGDFRDDNWTLDSCKKFIADRIAKHFAVFGETHFTFSVGGLLGGWSGFLDRTEKLIQWCIANNIPIRTYAEWADILYNQIPDPNENIIPELNVDLDSNNLADGYEQNVDGILVKSDGYPNHADYCYSINKIGLICSVLDFGGIEKGYNEFEIWTKGATGNFIDVIFRVGDNNFKHFKLPAESPEWKRYTLSQSLSGDTALYVPENVSLISMTVKCINYSSGEIRISGMKLSKSFTGSNFLNVSPTYANISQQPGTAIFNIYSNIDWTVTKDTSSWFSISTNSGNDNSPLVIQYQQNSSYTPRSGKVLVSGGGQTRVLMLTQSATQLLLNVEPTQQAIKYRQDTTFFKVTFNSDWTAAQDGNWFTITPTKGMNNDTLIVRCSENTTAKTRTGKITFSGSGMTKTVNLIQNALSFFDGIPQSFELFQNYPNPFNPKTKIRFSVPRTSYVLLKVYDILGNEVRTLINEEKQIGNHEIEFDGSNLTSGIYFYRLQAFNIPYFNNRNNFFSNEPLNNNMSRKMIHLK